MKVLRTPEAQFANLVGYPFESKYVEFPFEGIKMRMHYLDEGKPNGELIVLLHGQPSWSYLYRKVIPYLTAAGYRVIAPDLIGFGKSDKPANMDDISYERQEIWLKTALFDTLKLRNVTLYAQDWGGLISLRIVAFHPEYFKRVMVANTGLPAGGKDSNFTPGDRPRLLTVSIGTKIWQFVAMYFPFFSPGFMAKNLARFVKLSKDEINAYNAPFPSRDFMAAPRKMPSLIPTKANTPDTIRNWEAWKLLNNFEKPFRTAFSTHDDATRMLAVDKYFQNHVNGANGQNHLRIENAGHFLQEDKPKEVAQSIIDFINENP